MRLNAPCTIGLFGFSGSGKSSYIKKLLENANAVFSLPVDKIIFAYNVWQDMYAQMERNVERIQFYNGLPTRDLLLQWGEKYGHLVLVLDDFMYEIIQDKAYSDLFSVLSHHLTVTILMTSQNLYAQGKYQRTISNNFHYLLIFGLRDRRQLSILGQQLFNGKHKVRNFTDCYDALREKDPFTPLLIDLSPGSDRRAMVRYDILPSQETIVLQL